MTTLLKPLTAYGLLWTKDILIGAANRLDSLANAYIKDTDMTEYALLRQLIGLADRTKPRTDRPHSEQNSKYTTRSQERLFDAMRKI